VRGADRRLLLPRRAALPPSRHKDESTTLWLERHAAACVGFLYCSGLMYVIELMPIMLVILNRLSRWDSARSCSAAGPSADHGADLPSHQIREPRPCIML
jgi:hypothetical protein